MAKVRKAVIPAAGRGTRMFPATAAVRKEMFPLIDRDNLAKPQIQIAIEEAIDSGVEEVCIVTPPGESIGYRDYFRRPDEKSLAAFRGKDWAVRQAEQLAKLSEKIFFAEQPTPEGFGHAVFQTRAFVGNEPFLLMLGDHIFISSTKDRCAAQLIKAFESHGDCDAMTAVQPTPQHLLHLFGVIRGRPTDNESIFQAELIIEKPTIEQAKRSLVTPDLPPGNFLAHFGTHVFSPRIFESLQELIDANQREKGEFQMTAAQEILRQRGGKYFCAILQGDRYDTGIPAGFIEAQLALALSGSNRVDTAHTIARLLAAQIRD